MKLNEAFVCVLCMQVCCDLCRYLLLKSFKLHLHVLKLLSGVQKLLTLLLSTKKELQDTRVSVNYERNKKKVRGCKLQGYRQKIEKIIYFVPLPVKFT